MKIAILYIGIGKYIKFFEEFYQSCEKYFFPQLKKEYFLFTDSKLRSIKNVNIVKVEDEGWPNNTLNRFKFFLQIEKEVSEIPYIFFFNSNYLFKQEINEEDNILSQNIELVTLCWNKVNKKKNINFTYERNKSSTAYIPYNKGEYYYQGGFYGGKTNSFFKLCKECLEMVENDKKNGYIAIWHDESYLNKYLVDKSPKRVNEIYGMPEEWIENTEKIKAILRNKENFLGQEFIKSMKQDKNKKNILEKIFLFLEKIKFKKRR